MDLGWRCALLAPLILLAAGAPSQENPAQELFRADFQGGASAPSWELLPRGAAVIAEAAGGHYLRVERSEPGRGGVMARVRLPMEEVRGKRLRLEARIRAESVSKPPNQWNGVKFMLHTTAPSGPKWEQPDGIYGTFDWKRVRFSISVRPDITEAWLLVGLEEVTGTASFDDIVIRSRAAAVAPASKGSPFRGHELPRLRGAMIGQVNAEDLRVFAQEWKGNHVRWQLTWGGFPKSPADNGDLSAYDIWLESELKRLDSLLPLCEPLGIRVLIDLHTPPGGRDDSSVCRIFQEKRFQDKFLQVWERIVKRYRHQNAVWGYDLVNEPVEGPLSGDLEDWQELAARTARVIRALDPRRAIVVEPAPWGGPEAIGNLDPLPIPGIVYSVHMYQPFKFTHQGIYDNPTGVSYPGRVDGKRWDRAELKRALQPVVDFQRRHNVHIYLGEFSAIRWAPGTSARDYLSDVIEIAEENGWDWAYHAFREWDGWSVEHGPNRSEVSRAESPTDRKALLLSWFKRNKR